MRILFLSILASVSLLHVNGQTPKELRSFNEFSLESYKNIRTKGGNVFFSPLGTYVTLGILSEGASGTTKVEIDSILGIKRRLSVLDIQTEIEAILNRNVGNGVLKAANGFWIDQNISLQPDFKKDYEGAYMKQMSFDNPKAVAESVNDWASKQTDGTIPSLISEKAISRNTRLLLCNSLYLNMDWNSEFDADVTYRGAFRGEGGVVDTLKFMRDWGYYEYAFDKDFHYILKPLDNEEITFCWIIPKDGKSLEAIEEQLTGKKMNQLHNTIYRQRVNLKVPKFSLEQTLDMKPILEKMGVKSMFLPGADFSRMSEDSLFVEAFTQKSKIDVNEERIVAASITLVRGGLGSAVGMPDPNVPIDVFADVPFMFMVMDRETSGVLFMGRYASPTKADIQSAKEDYNVIHRY